LVATEFKKCYQSCATCTAVGNATTHNCVNCDNANSYFKLEDATTQCWKDADATRPQNYVLVATEFKKCYQSCATCSAEETDNMIHNCTACDTGNQYYPLSDSSNSKCFKQADPLVPANY